MRTPARPPQEPKVRDADVCSLEFIPLYPFLRLSYVTCLTHVASPAARLRQINLNIDEEGSRKPILRFV